MKVALFALLIGLQAVDIATTLAVLKKGGTEQNPLIAKVIAWAKDPLMGLLLLKAGAIAVLGVFYTLIPTVAMALLCAAYCFVCYHNWQQAKAVKGP